MDIIAGVVFEFVFCQAVIYFLIWLFTPLEPWDTDDDVK